MTVYPAHKEKVHPPGPPLALPPEQTAGRQCVAWRWETRDGKRTKPPVNPHTGGLASVTNPATWGTHAEALQRVKAGNLPGWGYVLTEADDLVGFDLDHCVNPETGEVEPWAMAIVRRIDSYTQRSPSGTGLRIFAKGTLPVKGRREGHIEVYGSERYLTVTDQHLEGTPSSIEERHDVISAWYAEVFPPQAPPTAGSTSSRGSSGFDDSDVIRRCEDGKHGDVFRRLFFNGDTSSHGADDSAADLALCNLLRFYSGDRGQVERLFRRSGLYRPKWDRETYSGPTLDKAMDGEVYVPPLKVDPSGRTNDPAGPSETHTPSDQPRIDAGVHDLRVITHQAWQALTRANGEDVRLLRHGGIPVRVESDDHGKPVLRELTPDRVRHELARAAEFYAVTKTGGERIVEPPKVVVLDLLATPTPPLPSVTRLTECPTFAPDGTLQLGVGYHPAGRTYCTGSVDGLAPVPQAPTAEDVRRAVALYDDLFVDFPFASSADQANALAAGLLPYARDLIDGPTPMHGFEAPTPGSGKGLLIEALLRPSCGTSYGSFTQCGDDDEFRKRLTSVLRDGYPAVLVDNLTQTLDSGALASALTARFWSDRLLGQNTTVRLPVRCVWLLSANNPTYSTEMARRTVPIRIDPQVDRPWEREGFRHKHLLAWVDTNRAAFVWAGLVLIGNWIAQGRPAYRGAVLGSFEEWSRVMGGVLQAAGVQGFLGNVGRFYDTVDLEGAVWREFTAAWWEKHQSAIVGTSELFAIALTTDGIDLGNGNERSQRTKFGKLLGKQRDRVIGQYRVVEAGEIRRASQWQLVDTRVNVAPENTNVHTPHTASHAASRVNVAPSDANVHTSQQGRNGSSVNMGERFAPQPIHEKSEEFVYRDEGQNVHKRSQRSHDGAAEEADSGVEEPPDTVTYRARTACVFPGCNLPSHAMQGNRWYCYSHHAAL